jgi:trans-aconitate 2-methyltransferase
MPHQELLIKKFYGMLKNNGFLAIQVPCVKYMPMHTELIKLISSEKWKAYYSDFIEGYSKHTADFYYDILSSLTKEIVLWQTHYFHIMDTHRDIVKWYSGSGLRNYLDCLKDEEQNADFLEDYRAALVKAYPIQANGKVLFPFTRIFFVAKKAGRNTRPLP